MEVASACRNRLSSRMGLFIRSHFVWHEVTSMLSLCREDDSEKDAALIARAMSIFDDSIVNDEAYTLQVNPCCCCLERKREGGSGC